jgi:AcrR family transcriptional regulator
MPQQRERARPLAAAERRRHIVDCAIPLLVVGGTPTTREIADAAGIAEGTIFRVFADKRALLLTVVERLTDPDESHAELAARLEPAAPLPADVEVAVGVLGDRMNRVMTAINALREAMGPDALGPAGRHKGGPPAFLAQANRRLVDSLTELVFEPHREELRVSPAAAAIALRALVFGLQHPGMESGRALSPAEVSDMFLSGVASQEGA